ncbi:MAG: zinc-dependent alcohol dehydrogenase family protein [Rhodocyclales bacterium]|nr:zinc-dependent alcohol dehydrogenase family protein [Rhodocyclales bacterium]
MKAMVLTQPNTRLVESTLPDPVPGHREVLIKVHACAVCRTDLHVIDGDLPHPALPLVPGHEIIGTVIVTGPGVEQRRVGERVGVPWLAWSCGECAYCRSGRENLCDAARFTGYQINGGYAEYTVADARYCFPLPDDDAAQLAPLLCAGLIGYRALRMAGAANRVGIYGFGAAAHIVAQVLRFQGREFDAYTRPGDLASQTFARSLGAAWAGGTDQAAPAPADAALIFAPAGALVPLALRRMEKGGIVICAGIHMSEIPAFPYDILWGERSIRSVANLTRRDGLEFLDLAPRIPLRTEIQRFALAAANEALQQLRRGEFQGAAVLTMQG